MSDEISPRLSLPLLAAGQAQKEVLVNEALQRVDALVQPVALSAGLVGPPDAPVSGACWIVATPATGAWTGQERAIAQWTTGGWRFAVPQDGWRCVVLDRDVVMHFRGGEWHDDPVRPDAIYIDGVKVVGSRMPDISGPTGGTIIDSQARAVIEELLAACREHGLIGT
ncbi:MAG TPA: DUF2793 domain-containing protein [Sphingobium sp.]